MEFTSPTSAFAQSSATAAARPKRCANAVKHSPPGASVAVVVTTEPPDEPRRAAIAVADHGPGVPPELLPRLFERFARGKESTGLGLGLHLAAKIAEAHGGAIAVDPAPAVGARFVLTLPLGGLTPPLQS